jgi:hypothetical protein
LLKLERVTFPFGCSAALTMSQYFNVGKRLMHPGSRQPVLDCQSIGTELICHDNIALHHLLFHHIAAPRLVRRLEKIAERGVKVTSR